MFSTFLKGCSENAQESKGTLDAFGFNGILLPKRGEPIGYFDPFEDTEMGILKVSSLKR